MPMWDEWGRDSRRTPPTTFPGATILLVSTSNQDLWVKLEGETPVVTADGLSTHFQKPLNFKGWFSLAHKYKHKPTHVDAVRCQ